MCYFITTIHTYSECLLQHTASRSTTQTVPGADPDPAPNPTTTERIIRSVNNLLYPLRADAVPVVVDPGPSNRVVDTELREDEFHHITRTTYFQCSQARNAAEGSELWETPKEQRICSDAKEDEDLAAQSADGESEDDGVLSSAIRGACPVCIAVQKTIVDELKTRKIREAKDTPETTPSSPDHLQPNRRIPNRKRHVHHGSTRRREEDRPRETIRGHRSEERTQGKSNAEGGSHQRRPRNDANRSRGKGGNDSGCCICM